MRNASRSYYFAGILAVALASLWILSLSGPENEKVSGLSRMTDGEFESNLESWKVFAEHAQVPSAQSTEFPSLDRESQPADLDLKRKVAVWGTLQTEYGEITSFDQIVFYSASLGKIYSTISNLHGYYYIDGIEPGTDYRLRVNPAGMFRRYTRKNVDLWSDQTSLSVVLRALPRDVLRGRVVNTEGIAHAGVGIKIKSAMKTQWSATFITDSAGSFEVEDVPLGELEFLSTFGHHMRITGHVFEGDFGMPTNLVVDQGEYRLNGLVRDGVDAPLVNANLALSWTHSVDGKRSVIYRYTKTDLSGRFSFENIGRGEYELQFVMPAGDHYQQIINIEYPLEELVITAAHSVPSYN